MYVVLTICTKYVSLKINIGHRLMSAHMDECKLNNNSTDYKQQLHWCAIF